ncbi:hypothetical protein [Xylella taiwanensis]|uniref:hypothetical protein n=1 Tax=Xylella taiwanensis TaxID=1444770 RepID=UPI001E3F2C69|nr:hypothetical protein [Xylella taiwanensis]MCD8465924.1 hypothetical protein [Xylella taiwanensis]MCD8468753.1 hypothetical protein [Xylella taiwanensis]
MDVKILLATACSLHIVTKPHSLQHIALMGCHNATVPRSDDGNQPKMRVYTLLEHVASFPLPAHAWTWTYPLHDLANTTIIQHSTLKQFPYSPLSRR